MMTKKLTLHGEAGKAEKIPKEQLAALHKPRWSGTWLWLGFTLVYFGLQAALVASMLWGPLWLTVALVVLIANVMHAQLIAFHEASHGNICPIGWVNEAIGTFIGINGLMSLSLYRASHHTHHAFLATERDEELWPFVDPSKPRWFRRAVAVVEMTLGLIYTPLLFLRTFLRQGSPVQKESTRRRIWAELTLIAAWWTIAAAAAIVFGIWHLVVVVFLIPAIMAGNLQSLRKYMEHMGLFGATALSATRSIDSQGLIGRLLAFCMFNETYHGIHHKYPRLPQEVLPDVPQLMQATTSGEIPPYSTYRQAIWDMLKGLGDPRIGKQWQEKPADALKTNKLAA